METVVANMVFRLSWWYKGGKLLMLEILVLWLVSNKFDSTLLFLGSKLELCEFLLGFFHAKFWGID